MVTVRPQLDALGFGLKPRLYPLAVASRFRAVCHAKCAADQVVGFSANPGHPQRRRAGHRLKSGGSARGAIRGFWISSSSKRQTHPVREDLQSVWRRVLLYPRHRHLHENRRMGASVYALGRQREQHQRRARQLTLSNDRTTNNFDWKTRGYITADARNQTEYGTIRAYLDVGFSGDYRDRVQLQPRLHPVCRLHLGSVAVVLRLLLAAGGVAFRRPCHTGIGHRRRRSEVMGYTAQFGNGLSAQLLGGSRDPQPQPFIWNA